MRFQSLCFMQLHGQLQSCHSAMVLGAFFDQITAMEIPACTFLARHLFMFHQLLFMYGPYGSYIDVYIPYHFRYIYTYIIVYIYDESSKVVVTLLVMAVFKSLCGCVCSFCFRGVTQLNSSNPIGSASKTARNLYYISYSTYSSCMLQN